MKVEALDFDSITHAMVVEADTKFPDIFSVSFSIKLCRKFLEQNFLTLSK